MLLIGLLYFIVQNIELTKQLDVTSEELVEYKDILRASTTSCNVDSDCMTLILDKDQCFSIPMSDRNKQYFEITHTGSGGCDELVLEQPIPICKDARCVFTG